MYVTDRLDACLHLLSLRIQLGPGVTNKKWTTTTFATDNSTAEMEPGQDF